MKQSLIFILASTICGSPLFANSFVQGGRDSGGGDPLANEFVATCEMVAEAHEKGKIDLGLAPDAVIAKCKAIRASLESNPQVFFPNGKTVQCNGIAKMACVGKNGKIRIARDAWTQSKNDPASRIEVVTMELVKVLNGTNRYTIGNTVSRILEFQKSASPAQTFQVPVSPVGSKAKPPKFHSLFGPRCEMPVINQALSLGFHFFGYPQFDYSANDGLENFQSVLFEDPRDEERRTQRLYMSIISTDASPVPPQHAWDVYANQSKFARNIYRTVSQGDRAWLYASEKQLDFDDDDVDDCEERTSQILSSSYTSDEVIREDRSTLFSHGATYVMSPDQTSVPKNAKPFFGPCVAESLNKALEIAGTDTLVEELAGYTTGTSGRVYRSYKLEAMYSTNMNLPDNTEFYLVNLTVQADVMIIPYLIRIKARAENGKCRILDVSQKK